MLSYVVEAASRVAEEIILVLGPQDDAASFSRVFPVEVQIARDRLPMRGPVVGLEAGLQLLKAETFLLLPCDLPLLRSEVLVFLLARVAGFDAVIPRWRNGRLEPMCAVYRKASVAPVLQAILKVKKYSLLDLVKRLRRVRFVPVSELEPVDPRLHSFVNVNTPADLERARSAI